MASKSYTLLEYLVCLENKVKALKEYVENYDGVDLTEIQNEINNIKQQIENGNINNEQITNLQNRVNDVEGQLINKANKDEVMTRGTVSIRDFDDETRNIIQGMEPGSVNAVLGDGNVKLKNLADEIITTELGNNLITGTQVLTFDQNGTSKTYNCTNFIEVGDTKTSYALNFTYNYLIAFNMDGTFKFETSLSVLTTFDTDPNIKFVLTKKNTSTNYNREDHVLIVGKNMDAYVPDKRTFKKNLMPPIDVNGIPNNSISIAKMSDDFTEIEKGTNLYKKDEALLNYTIINSDGTNLTTGNFSNWIETIPGEQYCSSKNYTQFYFFDENKVFISQTTIISNPAVFTAAGHYVLIRCDKGNHQVVLGSNLNNVTEDKVIINKNLLPSSIEGGYTSRWKGKKWIVLGDSISVLSPKNYHDFVGADLGIVVNNLAVSGRTMLDGINLVNTETMPSNYDLVTVFYGANDQGYNCSIGEFNDGVDFNTNGSFYARVQEMIRLLKLKNPDAQIVFFTPIRRSESGEGYQEYFVNGVGKTTKEYGEVIKDCCERLGVHCLDLYEYGVDPRETWVREKYFLTNTDGTHLNPLGQATFLAPKVRDFLEKIAPYEII
ncbi:MAG: hypothetical protein J6D47_03660 [Peptostreptococcaceae bacterium]|nr:hypothetical protein [Peptostreptococcaceae bacterium]